MDIDGLRAKATAILLGIALLFATGCGAQASPSASSNVEEAPVSEDEARDAEYQRALSAEGLVTCFIGERFYDEPIENEDDAFAAVESVVSQIGGDDTTTLELQEIRPTETGTTYYTFRQQAGDVVVHGASVKLITDADHEVTGLVSAILPDVQLANLDSWEVTQEQAEQAVVDECASGGHDHVKVFSNSTEQTLIALEDENTSLRRYAWVVYTNNFMPGIDAGYLAHYVSADGDYLYAIAVNEPSNADSLAGETAVFEFDKMEESTWSGDVTRSDGTTMNITVPILRDPETGDEYLADAKRKILCADYAAFEYEGQLVPRTASDGAFADNELLIYDSFIKVWDFYDSIGWTGPDGEGTPSLLKMDMVDANGEVVENAYYDGRNYGFQNFAFNRNEPDGECLDIIGHEFSHCVTSTTMTSNLYKNDAGAINEGMSDILGNIIEMALAYDPEGVWLIGENEGEPIRSMSDPHSHQQPEFVWDTYYGPAAAEATSANDCGGAHINSSLLNLVSYRLDQAGMEPADQFYFWMNVALAMTPSTDYPQMAELLPWCMEQAGYEQYVGAVEAAVEETCLTTVEAPDAPPEGSGFVRAEVIADDSVKSNIRVILVPANATEDGGEVIAWVGANTDMLVAAIPEGDYNAYAQYFDGDSVTLSLVLSEEGWVSTDGDAPVAPLAFTVVSGETVELPSMEFE